MVVGIAIMQKQDVTSCEESSADVESLQNLSKALIASSVIHVYLITFQLSSSLFPLPWSWHLMCYSKHEQAEFFYLTLGENARRRPEVTKSLQHLSSLLTEKYHPFSYFAGMGKNLVVWVRKASDGVSDLTSATWYEAHAPVTDIKAKAIQLHWQQMKCNQSFLCYSCSAHTYIFRMFFMVIRLNKNLC